MYVWMVTAGAAITTMLVVSISHSSGRAATSNLTEDRWCVACVEQSEWMGGRKFLNVKNKNAKNNSQIYMYVCIYIKVLKYVYVCTHVYVYVLLIKLHIYFWNYVIFPCSLEILTHFKNANLVDRDCFRTYLKKLIGRIFTSYQTPLPFSNQHFHIH